MPIPFIIGAVAIAAGAVGVAAGLSAKEQWEKAKDISDRATRRHDRAKSGFSALAESVQSEFENLGQIKIEGLY
ncbi:hypothetical protein NGM44_07925 [Moraxella sp. FZFQ2102]|uniref:hypothetical protein n=1 Tax=Moraxella sp. FZFQ2102 TaxID=2953752 RepID=UPI00209BD500|nr:hypothetical protein [Moraxella sp. FZFQ2102]USZ14305.1 hypothetical protein NGM44_07925 [Moraxella sp. FZFQ2102]